MLYQLSTRFRTDATGRRLPDDPGAGIEAAARHYRAHDYVAARRACDAILARQPRHFDALHLRGVLHLEQGRPGEGLEYLRRAEHERPDEPRLQFHIGNTLLALKLFDEATIAFRRSLALRPGDVDTLNNLGNALSGGLRHDEAIVCFRQALAIRPDAPQVLYNLGRALLTLDRLEEADGSFRAALAFAGPTVEATRLIDLYNSLSEVLIQQGRHDEALAVCRGVPVSIADAPAIRWNENLTLLMLGDYAEGWRKYECRFLVPEHDPPREGAAALDLGRVAGQRVLVFPEQGRGDMIQFARYLPLLAARGAHVLVEMYADLKPLFETIDGVAQVVTPDAPMPEHDKLTPLLSLPLAFGTTVENIPAQVPYLRVPEPRIARWAARLGPRMRPRIGIAWWGSQHIPRRSMAIGTLAPVLRMPGLDFHALQKDFPPGDRDWLVAHPLAADHSAALEDFADTAALIAHMDLVISIDTSAAHLAGALGVPVWIMLPFSPDWRWLREREDSPWYPTARLFRQTRRGDWDDVVRRVAEALSVERFRPEIDGNQLGVVTSNR
jgi:tetratricopeptide (TPR) repeat protein